MNPTSKPPSPFLRIISLLRTGPIPIIFRFYDQCTRKRRGYPVWRLARVTAQVYVGGQQYPQGWDGMEAEGITAVVNMRESEHDDVAMGVGGERHLHLPTSDNTPITVSDLQRGIAFITEEINRGGKVYIHCGVGVGRAPSMGAAYLMSQGMSVNEALDTIRAVRPFIHLTGRQYQHLHEFANSLQPQADI